MIAPTGTIAFMMDCDTTGIEPDIALIKYKKLVGGGMLKIVNQTVPRALKRLGYDSKEVQEIVEYLDEHETIEGAPHLADAHLRGVRLRVQAARRRRARFITSGHLKMMGAVQPFISGAISKTINMPAEATVDEIAEAYITAWKLGLKAVAIYRDGSKRTQPLNTGKDREGGRGGGCGARSRRPRISRVRRKLPDERKSITHKFDIAGHEGYITVGMYEDGKPGEIFVMHVQAGLDHLGPDGLVRDGDFLRAAVRRAAAVPGRQVRAHALRAVGLHQEPADSLCQVDRRLPVPMDGVEVPRRGSQARGRRHRIGETAAEAKPALATAAPAPVADVCASGKDGGMRQAFINQAGRAAVSGLRMHHGAQRRLLQMHELRHHQRLFIKMESKGPGGNWRGRFSRTGATEGGCGRAGRKAGRGFSQSSEKMEVKNSPGPT